MLIFLDDGSVQTLGAPPMAPFIDGVENYCAQTCVKSGYITGESHYVIKVASGGHPHPNSGSMQLYSQTTGKSVLTTNKESEVAADYREICYSILEELELI